MAIGLLGALYSVETFQVGSQMLFHLQVRGRMRVSSHSSPGLVLWCFLCIDARQTAAPWVSYPQQGRFSIVIGNPRHLRRGERADLQYDQLKQLGYFHKSWWLDNEHQIPEQVFLSLKLCRYGQNSSNTLTHKSTTSITISQLAFVTGVPPERYMVLPRKAFRPGPYPQGIYLCSY